MCDIAHVLLLERQERLLVALVAAGQFPPQEVQDRLDDFERALAGDASVPSDPLIARIRKQLEVA